MTNFGSNSLVEENRSYYEVGWMKDAKFNVVEVPLRHSRTLGGGHHCVTCDLEREHV